MNEQPLAFLPELLLLGAAVVGLLVGSWLPQDRQWVVRVIAAAALLVSAVAAMVAWAGPDERLYDDTYAVDEITSLVRVVAAGATLLVLVMSIDTVAGHRRETEFITLLLLGALGVDVLAGAGDLLVLTAGYLLASVPLYALAGFGKDAPGTEASLKYYLMGALFGVVLLVGVTALYLAGGASGYAALAAGLPAASPAVVALGTLAVLAGVAFKAGAVPAHFWVPDVTEGTSAPVAAFVTTVPKLGALAAAHRLVTEPLADVPVDVALLVAVLAAASMTLGNLAAFFQTSVRRLLAYSTISQVGYLLMVVAVAGRSDLATPALGFYLAAYAVTNVGAFAVAAELPEARRLEDWRGAAGRHPWLVGSLVVCLLGLVGTPPTAVFAGKLAAFTAAADGGYAWLMVLAAVNTVASLFYYLRWIAPAFAVEPETGVAAPAGRWSAQVAYVAAGAGLLLGAGAGAVLGWVD